MTKHLFLEVSDTAKLLPITGSFLPNFSFAFLERNRFREKASPIIHLSKQSYHKQGQKADNSLNILCQFVECIYLFIFFLFIPSSTCITETLVHNENMAMVFKLLNFVILL